MNAEYTPPSHDDIHDDDGSRDSASGETRQRLDDDLPSWKSWSSLADDARTEIPRTSIGANAVNPPGEEADSMSSNHDVPLERDSGIEPAKSATEVEGRPPFRLGHPGIGIRRLAGDYMDLAPGRDVDQDSERPSGDGYDRFDDDRVSGDGFDREDEYSSDASVSRDEAWFFGGEHYREEEQIYSDHMDPNGEWSTDLDFDRGEEAPVGEDFDEDREPLSRDDYSREEEQLLGDIPDQGGERSANHGLDIYDDWISGNGFHLEERYSSRTGVGEGGASFADEGSEPEEEPLADETFGQSQEPDDGEVLQGEESSINEGFDWVDEPSDSDGFGREQEPFAGDGFKQEERLSGERMDRDEEWSTDVRLAREEWSFANAEFDQRANTTRTEDLDREEERSVDVATDPDEGSPSDNLFDQDDESSVGDVLGEDEARFAGDGFAQIQERPFADPLDHEDESSIEVRSTRDDEPFTDDGFDQAQEQIRSAALDEDEWWFTGEDTEEEEEEEEEKWEVPFDALDFNQNEAASGADVPDQDEESLTDGGCDRDQGWIADEVADQVQGWFTGEDVDQDEEPSSVDDHAQEVEQPLPDRSDQSEEWPTSPRPTHEEESFAGDVYDEDQERLSDDRPDPDGWASADDAVEQDEEEPFGDADSQLDEISGISGMSVGSGDFEIAGDSSSVSSVWNADSDDSDARDSESAVGARDAVREEEQGQSGPTAQGKGDDGFSILDMRDRVVIMLLFKQLVPIEGVEKAWSRWQEQPGGRSKEPLWRFMTTDPSFDRELIFAEAAQVYAFKEAAIDEASALQFLKKYEDAFEESLFERMRELRVIPIRHQMQPNSKDRRVLFVSHDPTRPEVNRLLRELRRESYEMQYAPEAVIEDLISKAFPARNEYLDRVSDGEFAFDLGTSYDHEDALIDEDALEAEISRSSLINLFEASLVEAVRRDVSDIHIFPNPRKQIEIHFRVNGELECWHREERIHPEAFLAVVKDNALNVDRFERDAAQDGFIQRRIDDTLIRYRVSVLPVANANQELRSESIVIRVLDDRKVITDLSKLGLLESARAKFEWAISQPHGMVILTGPTGSGKTTTLFAALCQVVTPKLNVLTVEDPVEYVIPGVRQVKLSHKLNLEQALRSILRHDPDVVMVGEMRDRETADLAIKLANTGHLTFSTLHTNDAPSAISRLYKMGVEPFLIAYAINLIVAQRLVRVLCPSCKKPQDRFDEAMLVRLGFKPEELARARFFDEGHKPNCKTCGGSGYKGRRAITETMAFSNEIRRQIVLAQNMIDEDALRRQAESEGMLTLRASAREVVMQGETSIAELIRITAGEH